MADDSPADRWRLIRGTNLKPEDRHVLLTLFLYQGDNGSAYCKQETLADEIGVHPRSIRRSLQRLNEAGIVVSEWRGGNGFGMRHYAIDFNKLKTVQRPEGRTPASYLDDEGRTPASSGVGHQRPKTQDTSVLQEDPKNIQGTSKAFSFPESLDNEKFAAAWDEWIQFRKEIKKKLTPSTISKQLAKLESWGSDAAVQAIEKSISQGWQGLFRPDGKQDGKAPGSSLGAGEALNRVFTGLRKHDYETDRAALRAFIGEKAWRVATKVGWQRIRNKDQFTEKQIRTDFENAWEAQA
ncbi:MAG: helix-turn-helix domain-containing protein [Planctomycetaceae bacterium]|nr:helix-turn-helix domain-containing protein [Planctomycetaceae bacterium]